MSCNVNTLEKEIEFSAETKQAVHKRISKNIRKKRQNKKLSSASKLQIWFKHNATKGRRITIQLEKAVDEEIGRLLKGGHIEKINGIKDDVFTQPTVIPVRKGRSVKITKRS